METLAAFVARKTGTRAAGQKGWLCCAAVEALIKADLVAEADVG